MKYYRLCIFLVASSFVLVCFVCLLKSGPRNAEKKPTATVAVSGPLTKKLAPETIIELAANWHSFHFNYSDFPVELPLEFLNGGYLNVYFYPNSEAFNSAKKDQHRLLIISFKHQEVSESGTLVIRLSAPSPVIRSYIFSENIKLDFPITKQQSYSKLPYWDKVQERLTSHSPAPRWSVKKDGESLLNGEMILPRLSRTRRARLPVLDLPHDPPLKCFVTCDTGMAFDHELPAVSIDIHPGARVNQ